MFMVYFTLIIYIRTSKLKPKLTMQESIRFSLIEIDNGKMRCQFVYIC